MLVPYQVVGNVLFCSSVVSLLNFAIIFAVPAAPSREDAYPGALESLSRRALIRAVLYCKLCLGVKHRDHGVAFSRESGLLLFLVSGVYVQYSTVHFENSDQGVTEWDVIWRTETARMRTEWFRYCRSTEYSTIVQHRISIYCTAAKFGTPTYVVRVRPALEFFLRQGRKMQ